MDLINTAEFALPLGLSDYKDPLKRELWKNVRLGGKYKLGTAQKESYILIDLEGQFEGYEISKCSVVNQMEYSAFTASLSQWQNALKDYFDWYDK